MSTRDGYEPGVPCWVDTWRDDRDAAAAFYTQLFGWDAARGDAYSMFRLRGREVAGLGSPGPAGAPVAWTTYVWVESADATAAKVREAGGKVVVDPFDSLDGGRMTILEDPAGALFAAWQPGEHRGAQVVNEPGAWAMSLLSTPDPAGATAFYGAVFGWESEDFGGATMCRLPGYVGGEPQQPVPRDVVAVMTAGEAGWTPDFWVADADATAAKAAELGGTVIMPPFDTGVGRTAVLADPDGAAFSISKVV
jgi:predicted enzyme related to lactoylglutathione lyase